MLIAEDHADLRVTLKMLLETRGHIVELAVNGEDAVNKAVQRPPDVIVMDLQMPVMDGITATRLLRARPETARVPIIALTAYSRDADWQTRALEAGCIDCLSKPLEWARFEDVLRKIKKPGP